jgi:hypothetical protein
MGGRSYGGGVGDSRARPRTPLDDSALDLEEGQADRRLPVLRRLEDEVVERVADFRVLARVGVFAKQAPGVSAIVVQVWVIP